MLPTSEIACFGGRELSLKGWQDVRPTTLDQAYNIEPISQVGIFYGSSLVCLFWPRRFSPYCQPIVKA